MTAHLTEEEFAEYLLGLSTAAARAHLLECARCREEVEVFGAALASFSRTSLVWSREQAAEHPVHVAAKLPPRLRPAWQSSWSLGLAAAAVLAFAVALPVALVHRHAAETASAAQPQENAAVIAEDNQMMTAIDAEISRPELSPVESFATFRSQQEPEQTPVHDSRPAVRKKF